MDVDRLMTREVRTCAPGDRLHEAVRIMEDRDVGAVPVCDPEEDGRVVGVVTDRDACLAAFREDRPLRDVRVEQAMTRAVLCCAPDTSLEEAERRMREHQVRRLLVIEGESRLVGIVSLADLAQADADAAERDPALSRAALGDTLRAVSQPPRPY